MYRVVRNRCLVHPPDNARMCKLIAAGRQAPHTVLTVEGGEGGYRINGDGNCRRYETIEDPAVLTRDDLAVLNYALRNEDRLTPEMRAAIEGAVAAIHAIPRPTVRVVVWDVVAHAYYRVARDNRGTFTVRPWSLKLGRQRNNEYAIHGQHWSHNWRIVPDQGVAMTCIAPCVPSTVGG